MKKLIWTLPLWLSFSFIQCTQNWGYDTSRGMKPLYAPAIEIEKIFVKAPQSMLESAKIYYKDKFIFAIEQGAGVHVIDNRDSTRPQKVAFIRIFGCNDIAIKGSVMYADNYTDLVTIDLSNIDSLKVLSRIRNLYPAKNVEGDYPPDFHGYFECFDSTKGALIGWKESLLTNPQCRR